MKARYYGLAALMVEAAAGAFFYLLPALPGQVPVHWNLHGEVDRLGSPWMLFALGPVLMAATMALFAVMPWFSPRHFEVDDSLRTYLNLMLILVGVFGYLFAVTLWAAVNGPVGTDRSIVGGLCVLAVLLGNLLGKVRRNFFIGIRTPWTLASHKVWHATHRFAGRVLVVTGLVALAALLAGLAPWISTALVIAGFLVPVIYSLWRYKDLQRRGELDAA